MKNVSKISAKLAEESESLIRSSSVVIGTPDYTYSGHVIHFNTERLLDVLNEGSQGDQPDLSGDFLQLHDMQICFLDGQKEPVSANSLVSKNGILFVGEAETKGIEIPCLHYDRLSHFVLKKPICVEIHMPSLFIVGRVHIEPWQRLSGALSDDRRFLPITNAIISYRPHARSSQFEFVAVNRSQITCIAKMD
jgi:hypothetical protein